MTYKTHQRLSQRWCGRLGRLLECAYPPCRTKSSRARGLLTYCITIVSACQQKEREVSDR